jgi:tetratricopeptide (TPR) repeat protein
MGEFDFTYARYRLIESKNSYMYSLSIHLLPLVYYPFTTFFHIYAGVGAKGSYLFLYTNQYDKESKTFKPGLVAKAGFFFPIRWSLRFRIGVEYSFFQLSGKPFHGFDFHGGVSYNFNPSVRLSGPDRTDRINLYYNRGVRDFEEGKFKSARENFVKVLTIDPGHRETLEKLDLLGKVVSDYERARSHVSAKRYYRAIPLLERAARYIKAAKEDLVKVRQRLVGEIPSLEKRGISLYERKDYKNCIGVMKRLLLIDPNNRVASIYLPRARKRYEALQKLK